MRNELVAHTNMTAATIYHDSKRANQFGLRTRYFRNCEAGGVEWMYAVDYASGERRWYGFNAIPNATIEKLIKSGMPLERVPTINS